MDAKEQIDNEMVKKFADCVKPYLYYFNKWSFDFFQYKDEEYGGYAFADYGNDEGEYFLATVGYHEGTGYSVHVDEQELNVAHENNKFDVTLSEALEFTRKEFIKFLMSFKY